ncbi:MAG TPA: hypothetical protein DEG47_05895, partial [Cyanobacteria bacterium UBA11148]|nr:hypothetical protein [Cyanobacteria bacterium UBA11148]
SKIFIKPLLKLNEISVLELLLKPNLRFKAKCHLNRLIKFYKRIFLFSEFNNLELKWVLIK